MNTLQVTVEPGAQQIELHRTIDAPRELVYATMNDPELVPEWWGPAQYTTVVDVMEPRPGGRWRFVQKGAEGDEHGFHGVYHDLVPAERIVQTFEYEGVPGHVSMETMTLTDNGAGTDIHVVSVFQSVEDRDGMAASGMESGAAELYDRLEALVRSRM